MKNQFVTYEIALAVKKLGFNEPCFAYFKGSEFRFAINVNDRITCRLFILKDSSDLLNEDCIAPLYQQVIDWFREKYKLNIRFDFVDIDRCAFVIENLSNIAPNFGIPEILEASSVANKEDFISYFKAREQAILKAIQIINGRGI